MDFLIKYLSNIKITSFIRTFALIVLGFPFIVFFGNWLRRYLTGKFNAQRGMIGGKIVHYLGSVILIISVLKELGFELSPLLGAAGIIGIAVGFASQTSVSNIISGLFLIIEKPFEVNDVIRIKDIEGQVLSVDTLSVKLKTYDNRFVRIPNETIIKSEVINLTYFPIRRLDIEVMIAFKENLDNIKKILLSIPDRNPLCLKEPKATVIVRDFTPTTVTVSLCIWTTSENFRPVREFIREEVKKTLFEAGIGIPNQYVTIHHADESGKTILE
ncbi:MAG: mechanosensitive ion channel family protein [Leptospiraceae bacterium]|nr:mechanosensitive ion channel family protein [Leptospiraceae bacterium]MCP5500761.1 mechanosensitive ion channel family protein [Leptospiraceae bacterium]